MFVFLSLSNKQSSLSFDDCFKSISFFCLDSTTTNIYAYLINVYISSYLFLSLWIKSEKKYVFCEWYSPSLAWCLRSYEWFGLKRQFHCDDTFQNHASRAKAALSIAYIHTLCTASAAEALDYTGMYCTLLLLLDWMIRNQPKIITIILFVLYEQ